MGGITRLKLWMDGVDIHLSDVAPAWNRARGDDHLPESDDILKLPPGFGFDMKCHSMSVEFYMREEAL